MSFYFLDFLIDFKTKYAKVDVSSNFETIISQLMKDKYKKDQEMIRFDRKHTVALRIETILILVEFSPTQRFILSSSVETHIHATFTSFEL